MGSNMKQLFVVFTRLIALLMVFISSNAYSSVSEFYTPSHRPPSVLVEVIRTVFSDDIHIASDGTNIVLRGDQARVDEVQELLLQIDHAPRAFIVELSSRMNDERTTTYRTANYSLYDQSFRVLEGEQLKLVKERGIQQVVNTIGNNGLTWLQVSSLPASREALSLSIVSGSQQAFIELTITTLSNGQMLKTEQNISGPFNEWLVINGPSTNRKLKSWSTQSVDLNRLYIRVRTVSN